MSDEVSSSALRAAQARAVDFETHLVAMAHRSERRAWIVTVVSMLLCLLAATGVALMLPLKERVPYLVLADAGTGRATLTKLGNDIDRERYTRNEAIARANITSFVRARESYELSEIGERDWKIVFAMASTDVGAVYARVHAGNNPDAPHKVHGRARSIRVKILSLQLSGDKDSGTRLATIRFQRSLQNNSNGESVVLDNRIATLEYTYAEDAQLSEEARLLNPLGFRVLAYRVDRDLAVPSAVQLGDVP